MDCKGNKKVWSVQMPQVAKALNKVDLSFFTLGGLVTTGTLNTVFFIFLSLNFFR
jgi:hypothetical protein